MSSSNIREGLLPEPEAEVEANTQSRPLSPNSRRAFLIHLAMALHSYGSPAARTEDLIVKAATKLNVEVNISVFLSLIRLSFPGVNLNDPDQKEIHVVTVKPDLDVDKLGQAVKLANTVGDDGAPLDQRLRDIASSSPEFGRWWRLFGYALSASMSSLLFSGGNLWDALFSFVLGLAVGTLELVLPMLPPYASVLEFMAALVVSFLARTFQVFFKSYELNFFAMVLSSLARLLPGLPLTLGISEMVAQSHVTGTPRIMYALFSALQINFGIAMGENLVLWAPKPVSAQCVSPSLSIWLKLVCVCGYTFASNVLLNARLDQWPGMAFASFVGYMCSVATSLKFTSSVSSLISAIAVGITGTVCSRFTGTVCSRFTGDLPLVMVLSGILLIFPSGIGVQGVTAMLEGDVLSGMGFVYNFLVVGLSITLGLLLAKFELFDSTSTLPRELEYNQAASDS